LLVEVGALLSVKNLNVDRLAKLASGACRLPVSRSAEHPVNRQKQRVARSDRKCEMLIAKLDSSEAKRFGFCLTTPN